MRPGCGQEAVNQPQRLYRVAWEVVRPPAQDEPTYRKALRWATICNENRPGEWVFLKTLGVAEYRVGAYEQAIATLTRSGELYRGRFGTKPPGNLAFIAMSEFKLGRFGEARASLDELRQIMREPRHAQNTESQAFLRDAEALISGQ